MRTIHLCPACGTEMPLESIVCGHCYFDPAPYHKASEVIYADTGWDFAMPLPDDPYGRGS